MGIVMGDESARKYLLMETHYDNPEQKVGIVDSSGLNVVMTRKLRPTNAGFFAVELFQVIYYLLLMLCENIL